jgi:hypothetical protein
VIYDPKLLIDNESNKVIAIPNSHPRPLPKIEINIKNIVIKPIKLLNDSGIIRFNLEHLSALILYSYLICVYIESG